MEEIKKTLVQHGSEINQLKDAQTNVLAGIDKLVVSIKDLTVTLAVNSEKHDHSSKEISALRKDINDQVKLSQLNARQIAGMEPTVNSVRGLMWKIIGALMLGMGGSSFLAAALIKAGS